MHVTGDYVSNGSDFSSSRWLRTTEFYIDKIHDLNSDNWSAIFKALHDLEESLEQDDRVQIGAPAIARQHEALLPADPPTPPPLD